MSAHSLEIILTRQLADCLSVPVFLVDPDGTLLFYNEPAEPLLGKRFEETGAMPVNEWSTIFEPIDEKGVPIPPAELPLVQSLNERKPAHKDFWIKNLRGEIIKIYVASYPIIGRGDRFSGAVAIFWSNKELL